MSNWLVLIVGILIGASISLFIVAWMIKRYYITTPKKRTDP